MALNAQARATDATDPAATTAAAMPADRDRPLMRPAETPRIGVMSGATSIAPMTTAVESEAIPKVAIAVASSMKMKNRVILTLASPR